MKIYEALYCSCIHESSFATLSLHRTRAGAEKAVQDHKDKIKKEWEKEQAEFKKEGLESRFPWDFVQEWDIQETELLD